MCDPCILRGDPVIFFEGYHPTKKKHIKFEKHYVGNLGAIIEDAMNEGLITEQSQIKCTVPDSLPHFERDNVMFTWRSDLSEDERKMVEDAFSARVFYH
jgi:hypothetical protein